ALTRVESGMKLGLGTGSTMAHFLDLLGEELSEGRLHDIVGVATSERTAEHAARVDIPVADLADAGRLDLAVDGADEVDPALDLIKGLGGALLREKMIAQAADRFVVIVDDRKEVPRLGSRSPLPVEVVPFAWAAHLDFFRELGGRPHRREADGRAYTTDNGNYIVDVHFEDGVVAAAELEAALQRRAGVVDTGFFLGMADEVLVAYEEGTAVRRREAR
ncbi:MAG TPA: ribose 5-phosphate isomerase A, partial [Longimicrobiales bacterium]|nr:ribose 5-phosphate isomerase A [Longimicrobiales bacterium]